MAKQKKYKSIKTGRIVEMIQEGHFDVLVFDTLWEAHCVVNRKWFHKHYEEIK